MAHPTTKSATLTISDNASPATQVISMAGMTVAAPNTVASVSSAALSFSTPSLTSSQVQTITLSNTGIMPLIVYAGAIRLTGASAAQFVIASSSSCVATSGVTVAVGGSCAVDVQYKPTAAAVVGGVYTANLSFDLNALPSLSVGLTGSLFTGLNTYYIHSDHLDSPRSITNTAGQEVWRWDNTDPFGNNIANENPSNLGAFTFNLRFPGQYFDRETGLHYNVNRDYNPAVGRYIESDPIGLQGGINTFGYVKGNPLSYVDPLGLWCVLQEVADAISSGAGGLVGGFVGSGGNWGVAVLSGGIGAATGYAFSGTGVLGGTLGGAAGGFSAIVRGGGGLPGMIGGTVGGAMTGGLAATASGDPSTNNSASGFVGGLAGGFLGGLLTPTVGNNPLPLTGAALGALGGLAGGLTQDIANQLLKSHICNCGGN